MELFGHILRLHLQTLAQQSMRHYFSPSHITFPIILNKDLVRAIEHFSFSQRYGIQRLQSLQDLGRLIELGHDRQLWKHLYNDIFEAA